MSATEQPDPNWPPPGTVAALEPDDFNVGLTAEKAAPFIAKEVG